MVHKLVLHAADPFHGIEDPGAVVSALERIGLVGKPVQEEPDAWFAGEEFLSLVTFLGCAPHIDLVPEDAAQLEKGRFCHVRWQSVSGSPQFRRAPGQLRPRCRQCRKPVPGWEQMVESWQAGEEADSECENCGAALTPAALNWRQSAAFGSWFLEIWDIHPQVAVPSDAMMAALEEATGTRCTYFYE